MRIGGEQFNGARVCRSPFVAIWLLPIDSAQLERPLLFAPSLRERTVHTADCTLHTTHYTLHSAQCTMRRSIGARLRQSATFHLKGQPLIRLLLLICLLQSLS